MKRLIIFAIVAFTAWYGYHHYRDITQKVPKNEAVVRNSSGETLTAVRLTVGGQTFVRESMAPDEKATFDFALNRDSKFDLLWDYAAKTNEGHWTGGEATSGPTVSRHTITVRPDGGVIYESTAL